MSNHDLWVVKNNGECWKEAVLRYSLYPEDREELMAWAIKEDNKCLQGISQVGNEFFIPAGLTATEAADGAIQNQARLEKAEQVRREAEREAELERLRAEAEYRHVYLRPGVPQYVRDLAAVDLMTSEELEEKLRTEILENLSPPIVTAMCERYLKLEGVTESRRWKDTDEE